MLQLYIKLYKCNLSNENKGNILYRIPHRIVTMLYNYARVTF